MNVAELNQPSKKKQDSDKLSTRKRDKIRALRFHGKPLVHPCLFYQAYNRLENQDVFYLQAVG